MRPSHRVNNRGDFLHVAFFANRRKHLRKLDEFRLWNSGHLLHHLRCVPRIVLLHQLEHAAWILQSRIKLRLFRHQRQRRWRPRFVLRRRCARIIPACAIVCLCLFVESGKHAFVFRQFKIVRNDESCIRVIDDVILRDALFLDRIANHPAQKRNIRSRTNLRKFIRHACRSREPRIHYNHFCVSIALRFNRPLESARMVLRRIPAHDEHQVRVLDVHPTVGHRPASECWSQT